MNKIEIAELAKIVNISISRFFVIFKNLLNVTPLQYINKMRLEKSKELLMISKDSISEIAWQTGFEDQFHFSRMFKKHVGVSPLNYKKAHSYIGL